MDKIKLAIIFGGNSSEYIVSLHSAASIIEHTPTEKFEITLIGITRNGKWLYYPGNADSVYDDTWYQDDRCCEMIISPDKEMKGLLKINNDKSTELIPIDCIFPVLHGKNGEDGTIQGLCKLADIPCVGCSVLSSAVCMDKEYTHIICENSGIKTAPFMSVVKCKKLELIPLYDNICKKLSVPFFVKPANAGSSLGISKVNNFEEFKNGVELAFCHDDKIIFEATIIGFEIGCAVIGNEDLIVGVVDEIEIKSDFFDYNEKYNRSTAVIHCPARISDELKDKAKNIAKLAYKALGCSGMARVDLFLTHNNEIILNEVNSIPGLTNISRFPSMLKGIGIEYKELIIKLVDLAMEN